MAVILFLLEMSNRGGAFEAIIALLDVHPQLPEGAPLMSRHKLTDYFTLIACLKHVFGRCKDEFRTDKVGRKGGDGE